MADSGDDIIGEKALRYKRNVLVISFIVVVVLYIPKLQLKKLMLFGGSMVDVPGGEKWALLFAMMILTYNIVAYGYYGLSDFLSWRQSTLQNLSVPNLHAINLDLPEDFFFILKGKKGALKFVRRSVEKKFGERSTNDQWHTKYKFAAEFGPDYDFTVHYNNQKKTWSTLRITLWMEAVIPLLTVVAAFTAAIMKF